MPSIPFNFTNTNQSINPMPGTNGYFKRKDVGRDTFFVLVDETASFTGGINLKQRIKVGDTTYTSTADTITTAGSFVFVMHPNSEYFLETAANFSGTATGVLSDGSDVE